MFNIHCLEGDTVISEYRTKSLGSAMYLADLLAIDMSDSAWYERYQNWWHYNMFDSTKIVENGECFVMDFGDNNSNRAIKVFHDCFFESSIQKVVTFR